MDILKNVYASFVALISLFIVVKITGNRQMSQVSMFDYISSVAIGSIVGEMAVLSTGSVVQPLVSMAIFAICSYSISYITCKSIILRRFFEGRSTILYQTGQIYEKNLLKVKLDMDELLSECRLLGYFDLEEIHTIFLENNGRLSVLPLSSSRPVTPSDLTLTPTQSVPLANVIIDGRIMKENLQIIGKDEAWVYDQINSRGIHDIQDIILATFDPNKNQLSIYRKYHMKMLQDIFE